MKMTLKLIPYILINLAVLFIIGLGELFAANWDFSVYVSASFWMNYITSTLATMLSFFSWANLRINMYLSIPYYKDMEKDPNTNTNDIGVIHAIKRHTVDNLVLEYRTSDISIYLDEINIDEKTKKFKYVMNNKRSKLCEKRNPNIDKIKRIEEQLKDEWISENIKNIHVNYVPITESYLVSGLTNKSSNTFRKRNPSKVTKMINDNIHKWILSLSYLLLLSNITFFTKDQVTLIAIYTVGLKVLNCVLQAFMGINYAVTYVQEKVIYELDDRIAIMENYIQWKKKRQEVVNNG